MRKFLDTHNIILHTRRSGSSHKCGRIEQNNGVFKAVLDRLPKADTNAGAYVLIASSSFMTKVIRATKVLSAFQLAMGY